MILVSSETGLIAYNRKNFNATHFSFLYECFVIITRQI